MEKYKNNEEAAKAYADLLQININTEQGKLQRVKLFLKRN